MASRIISVVIGPMPKKITEPLPRVVAKMSDGTEEFLFDFFPDEMSFEEKELVGLTLQEADELYSKKDLAYLRAG